MRRLTAIIFASTLLFSYQKGDIISPDISKKMKLEAGKIYVIDFFASWCESCKKEMDREKFELIGVDVDEDIKKGKEFQREQSISFRVVDDPKGEIIKAFDPLGMPSLYIVKDGKVLNSLFGAVDEVDRVILDELKEQRDESHIYSLYYSFNRGVFYKRGKALGEGNLSKRYSKAKYGKFSIF